MSRRPSIASAHSCCLLSCFSCAKQDNILLNIISLPWDLQPIRLTTRMAVRQFVSVKGMSVWTWLDSAFSSFFNSLYIRRTAPRLLFPLRRHCQQSETHVVCLLPLLFSLFNVWYRVCVLFTFVFGTRSLIIIITRRLKTLFFFFFFLWSPGARTYLQFKSTPE